MLGTKFRMWFRESVLDQAKDVAQGPFRPTWPSPLVPGQKDVTSLGPMMSQHGTALISRLSSPPAEQEFLLPGHILQGRRLGFKVAMSLCQASKLWGEGSCWGLLVLWTQGFHGFRLCAEHSLQFFRGQQQ